MPLANKRTRDRQPSSSNERLEARVSQQQKLLFQRAASLKGLTLTDFMIDSLQKAAVSAVEEHDLIKLTPEDKRIFVDALMNPPAPNAAARRAVARYRRMQER